MGSPVLTPSLAITCSSDVSTEQLMSLPWDMANSDVADWQGRIVWSKIAGSLSIRGEPAEREVLVLNAKLADFDGLGAGYHVLASGTSGANGEFSLQWDGYSGDVITVYLDDLGGEWQQNTLYAEGSLVYPSLWNGMQYQCVDAGITGSTEPIWWHTEGSSGKSGTATFVARQYLPALADGPITPYQWTEM